MIHARIPHRPLAAAQIALAQLERQREIALGWPDLDAEDRAYIAGLEAQIAAARDDVARLRRRGRHQVGRPASRALIASYRHAG